MVVHKSNHVLTAHGHTVGKSLLLISLVFDPVSQIPFILFRENEKDFWDDENSSNTFDKKYDRDYYNPVNLTMILLFFEDNFRSRNAKNTQDTSFES